MKTKSAFTLLFFLLFSATSFSQIYSSKPSSKSTNKKVSPAIEDNHKRILSFYPIRALGDYMMLGFEKQIGKHKSVRFIGGYCYYSRENLNIAYRDLYDISSTRLEFQYKYFLTKKPTVFDSWYVGSTIGFKRGTMNLYNPNGNPFPTKAQANSMIAGVIIGYQVKLRKNWYADLYSGEVIQKSNGDYQSADYRLDGYKSRVLLYLGLNIGFGF